MVQRLAAQGGGAAAGAAAAAAAAAATAASSGPQQKQKQELAVYEEVPVKLKQKLACFQLLQGSAALSTHVDADTAAKLALEQAWAQQGRGPVAAGTATVDRTVDREETFQRQALERIAASGAEGIMLSRLVQSFGMSSTDDAVKAAYACVKDALRRQDYKAKASHKGSNFGYLLTSPPHLWPPSTGSSSSSSSSAPTLQIEGGAGRAIVARPSAPPPPMPLSAAGSAAGASSGAGSNAKSATAATTTTSTQQQRIAWIVEKVLAERIVAFSGLLSFLRLKITSAPGWAQIPSNNKGAKGIEIKSVHLLLHLLAQERPRRIKQVQ